MNDILKQFAGVAILTMAIPCFANEAPVFDADVSPDAMNPPTSISKNAPEEHALAAGDEEATVAQEPMTTYVEPNLTAEQRMQRIEQQLANLQQSNDQVKMDTLQQEVRDLRGQMETLAHQLEQAQTQQKNMYADLDKRISTIALSTVKTAWQDNSKPKAGFITPSTPAPTAVIAPSPKPTEAVAAPKTEPNLAEEQQTYQLAYDLIKAKKYQDAIVSLQKMLVKYPSGQFAGNAHYWLGELYGLLGKNLEASSEFNRVVKNFPSSPKVSDAMFKLGLIYASEQKWSDAKNMFKTILAQYPGSSVAHLANQQLKLIKKSGY